MTEALRNKKFEVHNLENGALALEKIKKMIPKGMSVMNGSSRTLEQIGYIDYLKGGTHGWNNLHEAVVLEKDEFKKAIMRKKAVLSDFYLGSVHALTEDGQFIIASNTGSQLPHIVYTSPNLIFVISTKKIVPNLEEGMKRLEDYVVPLEEKVMREYGESTKANKILFFKGEKENSGRKIKVILINENLGF